MTEATNVIEALSMVMAELPGIGKDSKADPKQGGYSYRGIEAITREVQPLFAKHGVVIVPRVHDRRVVDIIVNEKPWTDTYIEVEWDIYGPGGTSDMVMARTFGMGRDNSDKGTNKAMTQCLKYLLLDLLAISDSADDNDGTNIANQFEEVNGVQIPLSPTLEVTRTGPDGVDATQVTDGQMRAIYAMIDGAYGKDQNDGEKLSQILGREIRHPREVWRSEFDQVKAQCKLDSTTAPA